MSETQPVIDRYALHYAAATARHLAHELVVAVFERSKLSQSEVARRLGWDRSRLNKVLNTPANITVETMGELLWGMDGSLPLFDQQWPTKQHDRNTHGPEWLSGSSKVSLEPAGASSRMATLSFAKLTDLKGTAQTLTTNPLPIKFSPELRDERNRSVSEPA